MSRQSLQVLSSRKVCNGSSNEVPLQDQDVFYHNENGERAGRGEARSRKTRQVAEILG